jgi:hypothetical protein
MYVEGNDPDRDIVISTFPDLKKCNLESVKSYLINNGVSLDLMNDDVDQQFENVLTNLSDVIRLQSPMKKIGHFKFPRWFNHNLRNLVILKKTLHRRYKESLDHFDYLRFSAVRSQCKREVQLCRNNYIAHLENTIPKNIKAF